MSTEAQKIRAKRELEQMRTLVEATADKDWQVRLKAVNEIPKQRKTAEMIDECVPALIKATYDENNYIAKAAIPALGDIGPLAKLAVTRLTELLEDQDNEIRRFAAFSLGKLGPSALVSAKNLVNLLSDTDQDVRKAVSWSLGILGPEVVPLLNSVISSEDINVRTGCVFALGSIGPNAIASLDNLIVCLSDESSEVRYLAAKAIGNLRAAKEVEKAVPNLKKLLEDSDPDVRWVASEALRRIGTNDAVDAWLKHEGDSSIEDLCKQLKNDDKAVREDAANNLLKSINKKHADYTDQISAGLNDQIWKVRKLCADVIAKIGEGASAAIPMLEKALKDENADVRASAAKALGKIGQEGGALSELINCLEDEIKEVRMASALALELIGGADAEKALKKFKWE